MHSDVGEERGLLEVAEGGEVCHFMGLASGCLRWTKGC